MDTKSMVMGIIFIALGSLFLADNFDLIELSWETLWPWFLIIGGVLFFLGWSKNRQDYGMIMTGTILIVYGALFLYCATYGWWMMGADRLWAYFIIGPGLGLLGMYLLGNRERSVLISGALVTGIGVVFLSGPHNLRLIIPIILIAIGIRLLLRQRQKQNDMITSDDS